ncbi:receptor-type tyrosine-protein phosphatase H isoform X2 [Coregonus clupeaformis]|uniref:receptor-type tyrosine-protein phosphatase H isoform X2 n=1 Tax=Coregonus clupeaformis TaxID=59861 RepID=UPI001E1C8679|nr:receptor-type tyrosine-protein phosphatase H isoform X2 [Coregonus clupeaformis]
MVWSSSLTMRLAHVIMCLCVAGVLCQATDTTIATSTTTATTIQLITTLPTTIPPRTIPPTTPKPPPANVDHVDVTEQTQTSVTLQWNKPANGVSSYLLNFGEKEEIHINASEGVTDIHTVSPLTAGTQYGFTLFTVFEGVRSTGFNYTAATAPRNVADVKVTRQTETSLTLQWKKVEGEGITYVLQFNNGTNNTIPVSDTSETVTYTVSSLDAGTKYNFSIFTVFEKLPSNGYNVLTITRPLSVDRVNVTRQTETSLTLQWKKVEGEGITYVLQFNNGTNNTIPVSDTSETVTYTVSSLDAGTKYNFSIFTVFEKLPSNGYNVLTITRPISVDRVNVTRQTETSLTLQWKKVEGEGITYVLQFNNGTNNTIPVSDTSETVTYTVSSLDAGTKYNFSIFTVFEKLPSNGYNVLTITRPLSVDRVNVTRQTETSLTLQWKKVEGEGITYVLQFNNGTNTTIPVSDTSETVTYTVSSLDAGTKYNFSIFTVFEKLPSNGYNVLTITRPLSVDRVNVTRQNETSVTLQWNKVKGEGITYELQFSNGTNNTIPVSDTSEIVTHTVSSLDAGTKYNFSIFTVIEDIRSIGSKLSAVTAPLNVEAVTATESHRTETSVTLEWKRPAYGVSSYVLQFTDKGQIPIPILEETVTHTVQLLDVGKRYDFTLFTVFDGIWSSGESNFTVTKINCAVLPWNVTTSTIEAKIPGLFTSATATNETYSETHDNAVPPDLTGKCDYLSGGYAFSLSWDAPEGLWTSVEVNVAGKSPQQVKGEQVMEAEITGVQPAQTYQVTLVSISGPRRSIKAFSFSCHTDPRGVIAWSVMVVLVLCLLVCLGFFIWRWKPEMFSRLNSLFVESKLAGEKFKAIPVWKFSDHYYRMSADTNRQFSEEYQDFIPVGTEQTQRAALLEENKNKNRFTNVLPYDWCRVKLTTINHDMSSDYINANYMPGYGNSRQYIATQGPLPATIKDFWRMIWEQRVKGVVMVTNCTERGRTKCEQYWPLDYTPSLYGDLLVTVTSEKRETNWTLREFVVKNRDTSEDRLVKHFHFTAWPDHGVPEGTMTLIQFRGLVRQHIESQEDSGPTVVHCSAGVGRTGTIIALDVILQQLERERAVGIAAFLHKMRLSRPLMIQTESQYIFLHQCIMDSLQPKEKMMQEALYENSDMIYANSMALRQFHATNPNVSALSVC